jgi:hypothetical protein
VSYALSLVHVDFVRAMIGHFTFQPMLRRWTGNRATQPACFVAMFAENRGEGKIAVELGAEIEALAHVLRHGGASAKRIPRKYRHRPMGKPSGRSPG